MDTLYKTIEKLCQAKGIRPGRLCADLGLSRSLITDLKMGRKKSVSAETAQKFAGYFQVTVAQLLGQQDIQLDILDEVDIAFYGEFKELTPQQQETVRDMVRLMRQKQKKE